MAAHTVSLIDSYIYGFVMQEVNLPFDHRRFGSGRRSGSCQLVDGEYPHLLELPTPNVLNRDTTTATNSTYGRAWFSTASKQLHTP